MKTTYSGSPTSPQKLTSLHQILACAVALSALSINYSHAATETWDGDTDGNWADGTNWVNGSAPVNNDDLIFSGTSNTATTNDVGVLNVTGIQFANTTSGESFSLGGTYLNWNGTISTAAVVGGGSITDTISLELRATSTNRNFDLGADHHIDVTGKIWGPQGIRKLGDGTLTLSGANTYSGTSTVSAGTLKVQSQTALGSTGNATTVADGATLELNYVPANNSSPIEENITLNGAGVGGTEGALKITSGGAGNELGNNTITLGSDATINTLARFDTNSTITDNGNGYTLTKTGSNYSNFLNFGGTANFSHLVIAEGDYWAGSNALPGGVGTSVTVANGAQLTTWGSQTIANSPDITFEGGSTFRTDRNNDTMSINGTMTLNGNVTFSGPQATHTANIDSTIGGTGTLFKTGPNTTILSGDNTHAKTQIGLTNQASNAGTLSITHNNALGSGGLDYGSGGTLDLGVSGLSVGNRVFIGNRTDSSDYKIRLDLAGNATGELTNNIEIRKGTAKRFVAEVGDGDTLTFSASTTTGGGGGAGITKTGAGTLRLTNANNSFSGKFYVDGGELQIAESGTINDQLIEVASGATFRWSSSAAPGGALPYYDGGMSGAGTFIKDGTNSNLTLRNFSGASIANIEVHQGTLSGAGSNGALGGATTTNYIGEDGGANNATMSWIGGVNGTVTERAGIVVQAGTGTKTYAKGNSNDITDNTDITLNGDLTVNSASTGTFTLGGIISGSGALTKTNSGTLELTGDSTYTGNTAVTTGTLALSSANNNIANSTVIDVASGATLDVSGVANGFAVANGQTISGTGSVVGGTTVGAGATLSPGNSPGTQTFDNLTWVNSGTYLWEINADLASGGGEGVDSGWDWIDVTNTFDLSGITTGFNIDITSLTNPSNIAGLADGFDYSGKGYLDPYESFNILSFGSLTGTFDASEFNLLTGDFANSKVGWNIDIVGNDLVLSAVFVPEPSSTALLGLGGLALMLRRKRS
jgi:fibronectin-binding autotransporter adhesin